MNTPAPPLMKGKVLRPAIIEFGLPDNAQLDKTIKFYQQLLGMAYPFRLAADMALLCVITGDGSTSTTVYWEVPGTAKGDLQAAFADLIAHNGCKSIEPPHRMPNGELLKAETEVCTLADAAGNVFGLIVNPPYPLENTKY